VPVHTADDPLHAVARGAGRCVEEFGTLERVLVDNRRR
jgi:rod shape-determining protein MreB